MYVRDELGGFSECAYSLLLSISFLLTHREAVTGYPAGHRLASFYMSLQGGAECVTRLFFLLIYLWCK